MNPNIENIRSISDFATVYQWSVEFILATTVTGGVPYPSSEQLDWRCESHEIPNASNNAIAVQIRGHKVFQPGIMDYSNTIALTFVETVNNMMSNFLRSWREACWHSVDGAQHEKLDTDAVIRLVRLNRQLHPIWEYQLRGCWLQSYTQGTLDGSTSDAMKPNLTIQYDYYLDGLPGQVRVGENPPA